MRVQSYRGTPPVSPTQRSCSHLDTIVSRNVHTQSNHLQRMDLPSTGRDVDLLGKSQTRNKVHSLLVGLGPFTFTGCPWRRIEGGRVGKILYHQKYLCQIH